MYLAYLLDDEPLALSHIETTFPFEEYGFTVAGRHTNPAAAREAILKIVPDVVFIDIQMGSVNGLDLIEDLRQAGCEAFFVVVSAHDRFDYARKLIRLDGFDYLIKPVEKEQCAALLTALKAKLDEKWQNFQRPDTMSAELNLILAYLGQNFAQKQSLAAIAQQFNIHANYICRLFSKHLNTTFSSYLTTLRMSHAALLLQSSEKNVKEIALAVGYDDYFYFCRVFRETYGCTPTQCRGKEHD
jgi:Response regulator containing CheY-like receiver domain and AraC-type DNA-binding domain